MIDILLEPFTYNYMAKAIWVSALVGAVCAFLSCYLILKGWALMGDALAHSVVPGVAAAYILALPYAAGAFASGLIAALGITLVRRVTQLREDAVIGLVFTTLFASGLLIASISPTSVNVQSIVLGNILAISDEDVTQVILIAVVSLVVLGLRWKDMMLVFFDENQARSVGLNPWRLRVLFFVLLSACIVAALQTVGAILVIAMVVTPGATAYLLTDRFNRMLVIAPVVSAVCSIAGIYLSYYLDTASGAMVVLTQGVVFAAVYLFSPRQGLIGTRLAKARRRKAVALAL